MKRIEGRVRTLIKRAQTASAKFDESKGNLEISHVLVRHDARKRAPSSSSSSSSLSSVGKHDRSGKLDRARSRLYRGQILQVNTRWKALAEIYKMQSFAQLCNLKFCQNFANFFAKFSKFRKVREKIAKFWQNSSKFLKKCDFRSVQRSALCRSRRELSNEYLLAKFGFDTAENEPI